MQANGISDPNQIQAGQELIIPGLEGVSGVLDTEVIQFGDSYRSLLRRTQLPENLFDQLNHLVSPTEFYVGASMTIPVEQVETGSTSQLSVNSGESLLELAIKNDTNVWSLTGFNHPGTWGEIPSDVLYRKAD
jgi:LysM repeat protein